MSDQPSTEFEFGIERVKPTDIVFGPIITELKGLVASVNLGATKDDIVNLALKAAYTGLTGDEVIKGIKYLQAFFNDKSANDAISTFVRTFFNNMILIGKMRELDEIFEPRGNLLTGLEPQLEPRPQHSVWNEHTPLILIPGIAGTILYGKNANGTPGTSYWVDLGNIVDGTVYETNLAVAYDVINKQLVSQKEITIKEGSATERLDSICDIDGKGGKLPGFESLKSHVNPAYLDAVPYDFRTILANGTYEQFSQKLIDRINEQSPADEKVYILAHSAANLLLALFINKNRTTGILDKIKGIICVSPPFGGCVSAIDAVVNGQQKVVRVSQMLLGQFPSIAMSLPNKLGEQGSLVTYKGTDYKASDMSSFLKNCTFTAVDTSPIYEDIIRSYFGDFSFLQQALPSHIKIFLLTAEQRCTVIGMRFDDTQNWEYHKEKEERPLGDGTVPYASLHALDQYWNIAAENQRTYKDCGHTAILSNRCFLNDIHSILTTDELAPTCTECDCEEENSD